MGAGLYADVMMPTVKAGLPASVLVWNSELGSLRWQRRL
jgi:hypothetical protein